LRTASEVAATSADFAPCAGDDAKAWNKGRAMLGRPGGGVVLVDVAGVHREDDNIRAFALETALELNLEELVEKLGEAITLHSGHCALVLGAARPGFVQVFLRLELANLRTHGVC
jgi:hypothetical protein